jgi:hypothetical protein
MTDADQLEDDLDALTPKVLDAEPSEPQGAVMPPAAPTKVAVTKAHVGTVQRIMPIACTSIEEAYRTSEMFCYAGMIPRSFEVKKGADIDWTATKSRMTVAILAGSEVGFGPAAALKNICVINGLATIFGQGAKALVQHAGCLEWEKIDTTGSWEDGNYVVTVSLKRRGQSEPYVKSFGKQDAIKAGLLGRARPSSPWKTYPERQTYWRAWTWCARDGFADALMGLTIAEELEDFSTIEAARTHKTDTSDLDDPPALPKADPTHAAGEENARD